MAKPMTGRATRRRAGIFAAPHGKVRMDLLVPEDLKEEARRIAEEQGTSMSQLVVRGLRIMVGWDDK